MIKTYNNGVGELTEIKKGKTGTGLLIENDGHIVNNSDTVNQIKEDIENGCKFVCPDHFVVPAVFQKFGVKNANGRIYPENVLRREVEKYLKEKVATRSSFAALDHPSYSSLSGHDVSHIVTDLKWEGNTLVGEIELQLTPGYKKYGICSTSGDLLANLLLSNMLVGLSSRGVGSVKQIPGGVMMVDDDFELLAFDSVLEPSTPGAYIKSNEEELQPFIENVSKGGTALSEKISKIEKLLS